MVQVLVGVGITVLIGVGLLVCLVTSLRNDL
jgi:hypothetical protein